jgi:Protein of unknown function (DUF3141)
VHDALKPDGEDLLTLFSASLDPWSAYRYGVDFAQRWILFLDTLRERGTSFVEQTSRGLKPVLHFDYDVILDGRGASLTGAR